MVRPQLAILPIAKMASPVPAVASPRQLPDKLPFRPFTDPIVNVGPMHRQIWLKFRLSGQQLRRHGDILVQRWSNNAGVALFMRNGAASAGTAAGYVPIPPMHVQGIFDQVSMPLYPSFAIPSFSGSRWFYLRIDADGPTVLNLKLMSEERLERDQLLRAMGVALYAGVILGLSVYSLFLMLGIGERTYGWYAAFLVSTALYVGVRQGILGPFLPQFVRSLVPVQQGLLMVTFMAISAMMFMRRFLSTRKTDPTADWALLLLLLLALVSLPVILLTNGQWAFRFGVVYGVGAMVAILVISVRALLRRYRPALFLLLGWSVFLLAVVSYLLMSGGLLPYRWYLDTAIPFGSAIEAVLLSLGLADRISHQHKMEAHMKAEQGRLRHLSETDGLTGLLNRRAFDERLAELALNAARTGEGFVVMVLDTDHFKQFNDRFGHLKGDEVLQRLARVMTENARRDDLAFRYGGEEFVLLLPDTGIQDGLMIAERIRQRFAAEELRMPGCTCSVSIGVAAWRPDERGADVLSRADLALYQAKEQGRNRVIVHEVKDAPAGDT